MCAMTVRDKVIHLVASRTSGDPLREHLLVVLADTKIVQVSKADFNAALRGLHRIVAKYKKYEGHFSESPSAPDTTKFIAPSYGMLEVFGFNQHRISGGIYGASGVLLLGLKIGANFGWPKEVSDADWRAGLDVQLRIVRALKKEADGILAPLFKSPLYRANQSGSAYGVYGIAIPNDYDVTLV